MKNYFHFFEEFDSNKNYDLNEFQSDYGYGLLRYKFKMITIYNEITNEEYKSFIVSYYSLDEIQKLEEFCNCPFHQPPKWWFYLKCAIDLFLMYWCYLILNLLINNFRNDFFNVIIRIIPSIIPLAILRYMGFKNLSTLKNMMFYKTCNGCITISDDYEQPIDRIYHTINARNIKNNNKLKSS